MNPRRVKMGNLKQLQEQLLGSQPYPVFVSIDFESTQVIINDFKQCSNAQVGISILDTQDIESTSPKTAITTYNFVTGSSAYFAEAAKKYLFGTSEHIPTSNMLNAINRYINRNRNIILVGHAFAGDVAVLRSLGFDLQSSVLCYFDTSALSAELKIGGRGLGGLLYVLNCPRSMARLHNAGNDANFTLRVLLLLALKGWGEQATNGHEQENTQRMDTLRAIAMTPLPGRKPSSPRKPRKKQLSKSWTPEVQDHTREQRRLRRLENAVATSCHSRYQIGVDGSTAARDEWAL